MKASYVHKLTHLNFFLYLSQNYATLFGVLSLSIQELRAFLPLPSPTTVKHPASSGHFPITRASDHYFLWSARRYMKKQLKEVNFSPDNTYVMTLRIF